MGFRSRRKFADDMDAARVKHLVGESGAVREHERLVGQTTNNDFFMANSIQDAPCQAWMLDGPPDAARNEGTGKREIDDQPDDAAYREPIDKAYDNNPVPGIMLPRPLQ